MTCLRVGTRSSDLARWQADFVAARLDELGVETEMVYITSKGDQDQETPFREMEGTGFFTKELEEALLAEKVDLAVHSYKDLETRLPDGLIVGAVLHRADPADVLLAREGALTSTAPIGFKEGAVVGTASMRRRSLLTHQHGGLRIENLRGNVNTRLRKLREGQYDAILLAKAGLDRLGLDISDLQRVDMDTVKYVPAPGQGALAIEIRGADTAALSAVCQLHESGLSQCVVAERMLLRYFDGGCGLPLGAHARPHEDHLHLHAYWGPVADDGSVQGRYAEAEGKDPVKLAAKVFELLTGRAAPDLV